MGDKTVSIAFSVALHLLLIGILVFSFEHRPETVASTAPHPEPIQATAANQAQVMDELQRLRDQERRKKADEAARKRRAAEALRRARAAREAEQKRLSQLKAQRAAEQKQLAAEEAKRKTEQRRLAEAKRQQAALEAKRKAEAEARAKAQAEAKRKAEAEAKAKAAAEAKRKAEEAKRKEAEEALKAQMAAEERRLAAERQSRLNTLLARYKADIQNKVQRNWLRPAGVPDGLRCTVLVRQTPVGDVIEVQIITSSGNPLFDRSVENAVRKASPLPSPPIADVFDREIQFEFVPTER